MNRKRFRDWGLTVGEMAPGPLNKISDVPGVTVGHATLDDTYHKTGVTVIIPAPGNLFADKLTAAAHVINGFGKTVGTIQLDELGTLETPIALTGTLNVWRIADALAGYTVDRCRAEGLDCRSVNPVVGETNDSDLNRAADRPLGAAHLAEAMANACADFDEGDVGAGKGTVCLGFKGGIGSASRTLTLEGQVYTVGALVQSNFGCRDDLTITGFPAGRMLRAQEAEAPLRESDQGSCMVVIATDLPLTHLQLTRVLHRAVVGLARVGSFIGHGSGDVVLGFTTANRCMRDAGSVRPMLALSDGCMDAAFRAAAESVEEALLNALCTADRVTGNNGRDTVTVPGLSEVLPAILEAMSVGGQTGGGRP